MTTNTGEPRISQLSDGRFVVNLNGLELEQQKATYPDLESAIEGRDKYLRIVGEAVSIPTQPMSDEDLWRFAIDHQENTVPVRDWTPILVDTDKPIGLAWLSDIHIGGPHTDYKSLKSDAELIAATPGLYAEFHGDGIDNWIVGRLKNLQRGQIMTHRNEVKLFLSWLKIIKDKLLWMVSGNHDLWTEQMSGIDLLRDVVPHVLGINFLYDPYEIRTQLQLNDEARWKIITRHQWRGSSIYNVTHGIERAWKFNHQFDVGVGGHTHQGTLARPFITTDKSLSWAILTGTYKLHDQYQTALGFRKSVGSGVGVSIFYPDGRHEFMYNLQTAVEFLKFLRGE